MNNFLAEDGESVPVPEMFYETEVEICFESVIPKNIYRMLDEEMDETGNDRNEVISQILLDGLIKRKKDRGDEIDEDDLDELETILM